MFFFPKPCPRLPRWLVLLPLIWSLNYLPSLRALVLSTCHTSKIGDCIPEKFRPYLIFKRLIFPTFIVKVTCSEFCRLSSLTKFLYNVYYVKHPVSMTVQSLSNGGHIPLPSTNPQIWSYLVPQPILPMLCLLNKKSSVTYLVLCSAPGKLKNELAWYSILKKFKRSSIMNKFEDVKGRGVVFRNHKECKQQGGRCLSVGEGWQFGILKIRAGATYLEPGMCQDSRCNSLQKLT